MKENGNLLYHAEKHHWWFQARREIIDYLFWNRYKLGIKPNILSVGCSSGVELEYLAKFGHVTGIDASYDAIQMCTNRGFNVFKEDITACSFPDESYDVIFAMDVLEHIPDHEAAYLKILRLLKKGGYIVITVPACMSLWSKFDEFD